MPSLNFDDDPVGRPKDQWQRAISGLGAGVIMVVFVVVIFGAGYAMVHHAKRSAIFQRQAEPVGASSRAKPSPGIPFGAKPPAAPPPVLAPVPADSVPAAITEAPTPGAAPVLLKAKDTEAVYTAKHLKIFGRGCEGRLELGSAGLDFVCASGSDAPLHFAAAQIKGANGNGIEMKSGEKFHFDLRRSKAEEQEIFRNWVFTHVPGAYETAGN